MRKVHKKKVDRVNPKPMQGQRRCAWHVYNCFHSPFPPQIALSQEAETRYTIHSKCENVWILFIQFSHVFSIAKTLVRHDKLFILVNSMSSYPIPSIPSQLYHHGATSIRRWFLSKMMISSMAKCDFDQQDSIGPDKETPNPWKLTWIIIWYFWDIVQFGSLGGIIWTTNIFPLPISRENFTKLFQPRQTAASWQTENSNKNSSSRIKSARLKHWSGLVCLTNKSWLVDWSESNIFPKI